MIARFYHSCRFFTEAYDALLALLAASIYILNAEQLVVSAEVFHHHLPKFRVCNIGQTVLRVLVQAANLYKNPIAQKLFQLIGVE